MINDLRDRLIRMRLLRDEKEIKIAFIIIGFLIFVLLANIIYLNYLLFNKSSQNSSVNISSSVATIPSAPVTITAIPTQTSPTVAPTFAPQVITQTNSQVKDFYIPLGNGTNQTTDFVDVSGVVASVDFGSYQNIKEIRFEASVTVPTANESVTVRLFNVTDKHPVWYSEMSMNGGAFEYLVSQPVSYDTGVKTYQVQMKTQLGYLANLAQSRIHITLK